MSLIVGILSVVLFICATVVSLLILNLVESFKKAQNNQVKQSNETEADTEKKNLQ